ncbi:hypothetical protein I3842_16G010900 [Carya illinoinensis]|uniref:NB-ARC domain-containing protein n=1 Tax=Carya illinoinensis TaxID=32201 RepID=A0A922D3S3_CARIL|nr:hypothetical protein I3842_16G010900 [Carya illinoinensis]
MEILSSIVGKIGESLVLPIGEQFGYLISYKSNIMILEEKFLKLREKKEAVQQSVGGAEWNQEVVASEVKTWLTNVGERIEEVGKFLEGDAKTNRMCMNGWCPNLKFHYSLGKKAQKNTRAIAELLGEGGKYDRVFNIAPPLKDFESRKAMIRNVLEALRDEKIDMIAICGMGGIGKTEMVKEIARRVKADGLFHEVATAIQGELAEMLGPRLNAESLHGRANELYSRLMKSKSVLDVGVYNALKEKKCKILLTSRSEETCNQMRFQKLFPVGLLSEEEAWNLFKEMVAEQVVRECARLPIAIVTVGSALRNKRNEYEWKAALQQLKMSIPQYIPGLHPKVYSSIEFSYKYLESQEAKSCFLLCCLYPEDYNIPIEHLVRYGVAKRFLNGSSIVEQIRDHVKTIVLKLQRSNLLLDGKRYESIKMHDIVRDVAISIASRDEHSFMVQLDRRLEEWPQKDTYDGYTTISLLLGEMKGHPNGLKCPKLQFLRLSCLKDSETLPGNLFNGMNELKMLYLQEGCFSLKSLPSSIQILENLRMLNIESCRLGDVSAIGTLGKLEILSFRDSDIEELPREIGNLSQLKVLDMKGCRSLKQIAASVLSSLSRLQEFNNASLAELIPRFGQMKVLEISVSDIGCLPKEFDLSNSSLRFRINIEDDERYFFENAISLEQEDASHHWKVLESRGVFGNLKHCAISKCQHSKNIFWLATVKDLVQLKSLDISKCENIQEVFSKEGDQDKKKVISDIITLPNLEKIYLSSLPRLTGICKSMDLVEVEGGGNTSSSALSHKLFSSNTILWLPNLVELHVQECELLEVVFDLEGLKVIENHQPVVALSQLRILDLGHLHGMAHVWKNIPRGFQGFQNLISIDIVECNNLRSLLPTSVAKLLLQLQRISISSGKLMENVIQREDEGGEEMSADIIVFPQIHSFKLFHLNNLVSFSSEAYSFEWPSIKWIDLKDCPKLKTLGSKVQSRRKLIKEDAELDARAPQEPSAGSSSARELNYNPGLGNCSSTSGENKHNFNKEVSLQESLQSLSIRRREDLEYLIEALPNDQTDLDLADAFCLVQSLELDRFLNLKEIYRTKLPRKISELGNLRSLKLYRCNSLKNVFSLPTAKGLVQLQELIVRFCENIEEILSLEGDDEKSFDVIKLPKLTYIELECLPRLIGFSQSMDPVVELLRSTAQSSLNGQEKCDNLKSLLPASVAKLLAQLQSVEIRECQLMENIIEKEDEVGEEIGRANIIVFPQIHTFRLNGLENLVSFSSEAHSFEWPSIKRIALVICPKFKTFGSEVQSGRKLRKKDAKLDARAPQEPSIGSSSASTRESSRLLNRCLELSCVPRRRNSNPDQRNCSSSSGENKHNFNKDQVTLTNQDEPNVCETENQTKMCSLFPYYLIESLGNLEELFAWFCDSLEVIFELDEGLHDLEESNYIFNNLTELELYRLPKLLHIWKKGPRDIKGFNNLTELRLRGLPKLLHIWKKGPRDIKGFNNLRLLEVSESKLLVKLEEIEVDSCDEMKEIIAKESGDEEKRDHVIAFPQVKTLELVYLPKLECFCNEAIAFDWPSLENMWMIGCEELKMFAPTTSMKTPKLQRIHERLRATDPENFQPMIEGDLNTTIQHIIKRKVRYSAGFPNFCRICKRY